MLDLTAQQNALLIGALRERMGVSKMKPGKAVAGMADQGVAGLASAGKILLDLAAGEAALAADGVKQGLRLPPAASAMTDLALHRIETVIEMQKRLLHAAAEETHAVAESYMEGDGSVVMAGARMAEFLRQGIVEFVETEKKFLDLAVKDVNHALEGDKEPHKPSKDPAKVFTDVARAGVDQFIDAQKKLLHLAVDQLEKSRKAGKEEPEVEEPRTTLADVTGKSVHNFVTAQKSLMELAIKPIQTAAPGEAASKTTHRPRRKK